MQKIVIPVALLCLATAVPAWAAEDGIIRRPATGCLHKSPMVRAHELREQDDPVAAQRLIAEGLRSGDCRPFAPGEPVVVEDGDVLAELSKVHTLGDPTPFWVPEKAIETR